MTRERKINLETESFTELANRPLDELAVFIGGDISVFDTLISEISKLDIPQEEKDSKSKHIYQAAKESGINFATLKETESISGELDK